MLNELKTQKLVDAFRSDSSILETFFNSDVVAREKILLQLSTDHSLELSSSEINYIAKDPEDLISDLELTDSELELVSGGKQRLFEDPDHKWVDSVKLDPPKEK